MISSWACGFMRKTDLTLLYWKVLYLDLCELKVEACSSNTSVINRPVWVNKVVLAHTLYNWHIYLHIVTVFILHCVDDSSFHLLMMRIKCIILVTIYWKNYIRMQPNCKPNSVFVENVMHWMHSMSFKPNPLCSNLPRECLKTITETFKKCCSQTNWRFYILMKKKRHLDMILICLSIYSASVYSQHAMYVNFCNISFIMYVCSVVV